MVNRAPVLALALCALLLGGPPALSQAPPPSPTLTEQPAPDLAQQVQSLRAQLAQVQSKAAAEARSDHALNIVAWMAGIFAIISAAFLIFLARSVRQSFWEEAKKQGNDNYRSQLLQLPLGVPDGSIRALLSIFVIIFGLIVLVLQRRLGLDNVEAISGFVGIVITFYFTARSGDQVQKAVDAANQATTNANTAVAKVTEETKAQITDVAQTLIRASVPAATPLATASAASAAAGQPLQARLREIRDKLGSVRQVAAAAAGLGVGGDLLSGADKTVAAADGLVAAIEPLLTGNPDPAALASVLKTAEDAISPLENAGLPGALADAIAVLRGTLSVAGPIVAGIPGGPIGIAGGIVLAGVKLAQNAQQFEALKTALLNKPFDPALMPAIVVDGNAATAALEMSPHLKALFAGSPPVVATALMREVLRRTPAGVPVPASEIAEQLVRDGLDAEGQVIQVRDRVASAGELAQAMEEYRSSIVYRAAREQLSGTVDVPEGPGMPASPIELRRLADAAQALSGIPAAAGQIERLVYLAEALGKLPNGTGAVTDLVVRSLGLAQGLLPKRA